MVVTVLAVSSAAAAPRGVRVLGQVARLPAGEVAEAMAVDASGRFFVAHGTRISSFAADGSPIATWGVPVEPGMGYTMLAGTGADGSVYATPAGSHTVHRFTARGQLLRSWDIPATIPGNEILTVSVDPRGSLVIGDLSSFQTIDVGLKRYTFDGAYLGLVPGPAGGGITLPDGRRWIAQEEGLIGVAPTGRRFAEIGQACATHSGVSGCPGGSGAFGVSPPTALVALPGGRLLTTESDGRVQTFGGDGRLLAACPRLMPVITAAAYDSTSTTVLLADGSTVVRARLTARRVGSCRPAPFKVGDLHATRRAHGHRTRWRVRYRISRAAHVTFRYVRMPTVACNTAPADPFDPSRGCARVADVELHPQRWQRAGRGADTVTLAGRGWFTQVRAVDRRGNTVTTTWRTLADLPR